MDASRRWKERNKEHVKAYDRAYREKNREALRERHRAHKQAKYADPAHREVLWEKHIRDKYGVDAQQYNCMLVSQAGVCAICKQPETATRNGKVKKLAVDHDHVTGAVRGLLCQRCNTLVLRFDNSVNILRAAIDCLSRGQTDGS